jgi:hypothetical protein
MRLIIAGSRHLTVQYDELFKIIDKLGITPIDMVVSGGARGIDRSGEDMAEAYEIPLRRFPADWDKYGRSAGPIRNLAMAIYADALLLIWDGESRGSANMLQQMKRLKKPVYEIIRGKE